jgi:type II secretion system (T2SS) protein E
MRCTPGDPANARSHGPNRVSGTLRIDETGLARLLARQWELPFLSDEEVEVATAAVEVLPLECAQRTGACVTAVRNGGPAVAIAEPNEQRFAELRALLAAEPTFVVVTPTTLTRLLEQLAAAEADAKLQDAAAAASEAEQAQADTLLGELDAVTAALGTLRRVWISSRSVATSLSSSWLTVEASSPSWLGSGRLSRSGLSCSVVSAARRRRGLRP